MRIWVDVTNSPQVPFFSPLIALLEARGHEVQVTTRDFAQTVELLRLRGHSHHVVGPGHGGASRRRKARAMVGRVRALRAFARGRGFDLALSHASHELPLVARSLGIPSSYAFDYEFARVQHGVGCRAARRVVVPDAIPQNRLDSIGAPAKKVCRYPGLKEEYYLHDFVPDPTVLDTLGLNRERALVVVRTPADMALYHRHGNELLDDVLERLGRDPELQAVVLPRTAAQREAIEGRGLPSLVVPGHAIDAQSLVALSDLVVSAGGTMNREAIALGVPVCTIFAGRLGSVDEALIREGRLRPLRSVGDLVVEKRADSDSPPTRDPALLLDLFVSALEG